MGFLHIREVFCSCPKTSDLQVDCAKQTVQKVSVSSMRHVSAQHYSDLCLCIGADADCTEIPLAQSACNVCWEKLHTKELYSITIKVSS